MVNFIILFKRKKGKCNMSLISDLKKENVSLRKTITTLYRDAEEMQKEIDELQEKLNARKDIIVQKCKEAQAQAKAKNNKMYALCKMTQGENITTGKCYLKVDEYFFRGQLMIEIIDNNNLVRRYVKEKFFQ